MPDAEIICCPPELRAAALSKLYAASCPDQSGALAHAIESMGDAPQAAWQGLLAAIRSSRAASPTVLGSVWMQSVPGNTAVVWPPSPRSPCLGELLAAAAAYADAAELPLAQLILAAEDGFSPQDLKSAGFGHLAELLYLFADVKGSESPSLRKSTAQLEFLANAGAEPDRLAAVLERTYAGTLDCPQLDGARTTADVIAGYRAQGELLPNEWYLVAAGGRDVGALILAAHSTAENWELVYMGLAAEARGCRWGDLIVRFAMDAAARGGAQRLVLAVDAANGPARATYRRAGFVEWERRSVYVRLAGSSRRALTTPA